MARVISCGGPTAGCWLDAIPSSHDYTLSNAEFCMASLLRLGASLPALRAIDTCIAQCGEPIDKFGYHLLTCKWGGGAIHRHDRGLDSVHQMLSSVGLRCRKDLIEQFEGKQRPDIAVYDFDNGKKLLLDITISHPWAQNYIGRSCTTARFAAAERDRIKNNKCLQMSNDLGYLFRPFSLKVFVRLGVSARVTLKQVSRLAAPLAGFSPEEFLNEWRRRLSVCLQKGNARILFNKVDTIIGRQQPSRPNTCNTVIVCHFGVDFT